jgi:hypothetical protein
MVCQDTLYLVDVDGLVELLFDAGVHFTGNPDF